MKFWNITTLIICTLSISHPSSEMTREIDKIIALVNHDIVLYSDITDYIKINQNNIGKIDLKTTQNNILFQKILNQLIIHNLILQAAIIKNINVTPDQIFQIINYVAHQKKMNLDEYKIYLNTIGINYEKYYLYLYKEVIKKTICEHIVNQHIHIPSYEINQIIQNLNNIDFNKQFKLTHITISLPMLATNNQIDRATYLGKLIIEKYKTNKNIKELIYTYSKQDISHIITLYKTKWVTWRHIPPIFDQYLYTMQKKSIIGPIHSYDGIHILIVNDIHDKNFLFPITQVKIKHIMLKKSTENNNVKEKLLKIKHNIEYNKTIHDNINEKNIENIYITNHKEDLKWKDLENFEPIIQQTLLSLKLKEISMPINTSQGWCLIQLIDKNILDYTTIIHQRAYFYLLHQKFNKIINTWIQDLQHKSYIKIIK